MPGFNASGKPEVGGAYNEAGIFDGGVLDTSLDGTVNSDTGDSFDWTTLLKSGGSGLGALLGLPANATSAQIAAALGGGTTNLGGILGGVAGAAASIYGADKQYQAAQDAITYQKNALVQAQTNQQPWLTAGKNALTTMTKDGFAPLPAYVAPDDPTIPVYNGVDAPTMTAGNPMAGAYQQTNVGNALQSPQGINTVQPLPRDPLKANQLYAAGGQPQQGGYPISYNQQQPFAAGPPLVGSTYESNTRAYPAEKADLIGGQPVGSTYEPEKASYGKAVLIGDQPVDSTYESDKALQMQDGSKSTEKVLDQLSTQQLQPGGQLWTNANQQGLNLSSGPQLATDAKQYQLGAGPQLSTDAQQKQLASGPQLSTNALQGMLGAGTDLATNAGQVGLNLGPMDRLSQSAGQVGTNLGAFNYDPNSYFESPVYKALLKSGTDASMAAAAAGGKIGSGNQLAALQQLGMQTGAQYMAQDYNQALGQYNANVGSTVQNNNSQNQANLQNQSFYNNAIQQGYSVDQARLIANQQANNAANLANQNFYNQGSQQMYNNQGTQMAANNAANLANQNFYSQGTQQMYQNLGTQTAANNAANLANQNFYNQGSQQMYQNLGIQTAANNAANLTNQNFYNQGQQGMWQNANTAQQANQQANNAANLQNLNTNNAVVQQNFGNQTSAQQTQYQADLNRIMQMYNIDLAAATQLYNSESQNANALYNRQAAIAGTGQTTANSLANLGTNAATNMGNAATQGAAAQATGANGLATNLGSAANSLTKMLK